MIYNTAIKALALLLILLSITYFIAPTATVSFFPSYLIGIITLFILPVALPALRPIGGTLTTTAICLLLLLLSNLFAGGSIASTALFSGYSLLILTFIIGFYLASQTTPWFLPAFMVVTVGSAAVSGLISVGLFYFLDYQPLVEDRLYALGRLNNPVISAISYGCILSLCLSYLARTKERGLRVLTALIIAIFIIAELLAGTRGPWIGIFAAVACIIAMRQWHSKRQLILTLSILSGTCIAIGLVVLQTDYAEAILRRSFSFRPEIWAETVRLWMSGSLFWGSGIASEIQLNIPPNRFIHPHSIYVSTLYYGGIAGLLGLATLILRLFWVLHTTNDELKQYAFPLLVFGLTVLLFDGNRLIEKVDFIWLCLWLPLAMTLVAEARFKASLPQ